ncbi:transporter, betaine/carnitine/choline family [Gleimia coleocanis DSM 15436]|uniref:Transporter, betaine/carnitine/choline family n=1 Tax=Gleimia coleocanis DSM 15436 TaxID=525245 RepID=C0W042_9ACTO|nr:BCCT family transporter [Gleimia coleocanis]EEH63901.1 transporter, betaine/carnitine/choline family [Gleimia coleocanis DSM 15436]
MDSSKPRRYKPKLTKADVAKLRAKAQTLNLHVFIGSSVAVLFVACLAIFLPTQTQTILGAGVDWISRWLGSFYIGLAGAILVFVLILAFSRFGNVRLGGVDAKPEFSTFAWGSMLFAAGIGTDIMFFSVAEPISHYMYPPVGTAQTPEAAREAITWTLFHYGVIGWGMYALMGIALAYFAYNRNRPLAVRSALAPILKERLPGRWGDLVDIAAILGTVFGVAATLGIGVVQLNVGLQILFGISVGIGAQIALILFAVIMTVVSSTAGIEKGIRFLSQLNIWLALALAGWVFITGKTDWLIRALTLNIGDFTATFPSRVLNTFAYDDLTSWVSDWTLFFWAWWIAWASFIGMFLARISKGRSLREFIFGTMFIPFAYVLMWISIFGNSAISLVEAGDKAFAQTVLESPEQGFYELLGHFPLAPVVIAVATFVGLLFYVTSADSGALVMGNLSSNLPDSATDAHPAVKIWWAAVTGLLTVAMLLVDGIPALQDATIIMGLPFSLVLIAVMAGLYRALKAEYPAPPIYPAEPIEDPVE